MVQKRTQEREQILFLKPIITLEMIRISFMKLRKCRCPYFGDSLMEDMVYICTYRVSKLRDFLKKIYHLSDIARI